MTKKKSKKSKKSWKDAHDKAISRGKPCYIDPETGAYVFTEQTHLTRGWCCYSGCRHCPYKHINVPGEHKEESDG